MKALAKCGQGKASCKGNSESIIILICIDDNARFVVGHDLYDNDELD